MNINQKKILKVLRRYDGNITIREIQKKLKLSSPSLVHYHVKRLKEKGYTKKKKIYLIVQENCQVISGQGGPYNQKISIYHSGEYGKIGDIAPAFSSYDMAEKYRKSFDDFDFYKVQEIDLIL